VRSRLKCTSWPALVLQSWFSRRFASSLSDSPLRTCCCRRRDIKHVCHNGHPDDTTGASSDHNLYAGVKLSGRLVQVRLHGLGRRLPLHPLQLLSARRLEQLVRMLSIRLDRGARALLFSRNLSVGVPSRLLERRRQRNPGYMLPKVGSADQSKCRDVALLSSFSNRGHRSSYTCHQPSDGVWPWYSTNLCTIDYPAIVPVTYTTSLVGSGWTTTVVEGGGVNAYGLAIRWKSRDFATATSTATSSTSSAAGFKSTSMSTETTSGGPPGTATPQHQDAGLSTGAKAGIAAGAIAAGALVAVGALVFFLRRRRRPPTNVTWKPSMSPDLCPKEDIYRQEYKLSELPARSLGEYQKPVELA